MKILVFTEGTILMHSACAGLAREQRVQQSKDKVRSTHDYRNYIPVGNAVEKLLNWKKQGATILYLTSRRIKNEIEAIKTILKRYNFPDTDNLYFRHQGEDYKDVAEKLMPDILIEDDCESIGGEVEMTYPHVRADLKKKIKSVVVKEFGGIDHLPDVVITTLFML